MEWESSSTVEQELAERLDRIEERTRGMASEVARAVEELRGPRRGEAREG